MQTDKIVGHCGLRIQRDFAEIQDKSATEAKKKKGTNFYSESKHRFYIPYQPFDLFINPDLESSFSAANLVLTPSL